MRPYSLDLRVRVLADVDAGQTFAATARKYTVSAEWVRQLVRRRDQTGEVAPRPPIPRRVPFHRRHEADLRAAVAAHPGQTLDALRRRLNLSASLGTLWAALRALKISFKKKRSWRPSNSGPTWPPSGRRSVTPRRPAWTRTGSSSSTKPG